jgi:hypothetical protein
MIDAAIFMCSLTGNMARPWAEAGIECFCVDTQHSIRQDRVEGKVHYVWGDVRSYTLPAGYRPIFGAAFTPCTDVAGSGARDFAKKRGYLLRDALEMFEAARQCFEWARIPYMLENSVGFLSSVPHIGKPDHYFHPWQYAARCADDNYTKKTCIWSGGGFVMPNPCPAPWLGEPDDRIHKAPPGDERANFRSATPMGFSYATFEANRPDRLQGAMPFLERAIKTEETIG